MSSIQPGSTAVHPPLTLMGDKSLVTILINIIFYGLNDIEEIMKKNMACAKITTCITGNAGPFRVQ